MAKLNTSDGSKVDIDTFKKAIRALESPKLKRERERARLFSALYEDIRDQLAEGVSRSSIIRTLAELGYSISGPLFEQLLAAEAKLRGEPVPGKEAAVSTDDVPAVESTNALQVSATMRGAT
jgi:hypothetical protein